jgi:hypothetical protein
MQIVAENIENKQEEPARNL